MRRYHKWGMPENGRLAIGVEEPTRLVTADEKKLQNYMNSRGYRRAPDAILCPQLQIRRTDGPLYSRVEMAPDCRN
jgi:hypothetical protein